MYLLRGKNALAAVSITLALETTSKSGWSNKSRIEEIIEESLEDHFFYFPHITGAILLKKSCKSCQWKEITFAFSQMNSKGA